ncbi:MAG: hypothetical protein KIT31_37795 [Deltaproteobacteria bacterium]|nr:hypothetical protein [Deltaproteobacteria bacterium]
MDGLAPPEPLDGARESLVTVVGDGGDRGPRRLGRLHGLGDLREVERVGDALDLAHELRLLGAPALHVVGDGRLLRALRLLDLGDDLARLLAHGLVLRLLRHVLEALAVVDLLDGGEADLLHRRVGREGAQHVAVVDPRDRGGPDVLRGVALRELGERLRIAQLAERALADRGDVGANDDVDQRALIAALDDPGERLVRVVGVVAAGDGRPQARGALPGEVAQAALALRGGDVREDLGGSDLLDRDATHTGVAIGSSDLDQDGSVIGGQGPNGLGAHADVAVAVLGAKEVSDPHGVGAGIYAEGLPPTRHLLGRRRSSPSGLVGGAHAAPSPAAPAPRPPGATLSAAPTDEERVTRR